MRTYFISIYLLLGSFVIAGSVIAANEEVAAVQTMNAPPSNATNSTAAEIEFDMIGEAFDAQSAELLYREYHVLDVTHKKHAVYYRDLTGETFVEKFIDYNRAFIAPDFQQQDFRIGAVITSLIRNDVLTLGRGQTSDKEAMGTLSKFDKTSEKTLPSTPSLVVDAGFDHFIRQEWDTLKRGEVIKFELALPARESTIEMEVNSIDSLECVAAMKKYADSDSSADDSIECFQLAVKGWLISKFVKPIMLTYQRNTRRLLAFNGLGNINSDDGNSQTVFIKYRYF